MKAFVTRAFDSISDKLVAYGPVQNLRYWVLCIVSASVGAAIFVVAQCLPLQSPPVIAVGTALAAIWAAVITTAIRLGETDAKERRDRKEKLEAVFKRLRTLLASVDMVKMVFPPPDTVPPDQIHMNAITNLFALIHTSLEEPFDLDAVAEEDLEYADRAVMKMYWTAMKGRSSWSVAPGRALTAANYQSTRLEIDHFLAAAATLDQALQTLRPRKVRVGEA